MYIQDDSPNIFIPIFSFNNEFIQTVIFRTFKYTQRTYFQIIEIFRTT